MPESPVAMPAAGGWFTDPDFKARILRVTDAAALGVATCANSYSYVPALNRTSRRLLVGCGDVAHVYAFDGTTARDEGRLDDGQPVALNWQSAFWSGVEPDVVWALGGTRGGSRAVLYRIDVNRHDGGRFTVAHDFGAVAPGAEAWQLGVSEDDRLFTLHLRRGADHVAVLAWRRDADQVVTFPDSAFDFDESQVDKAGRYVIVTGRAADSFRIKLWDPVANRVVTTLEPGEAWHTGGHYDLGASLMINTDRFGTGIVARSWSAPDRPANILRYTLGDGKTLNWKIADHLSMRNDDERWLVGSTYGGAGAPFARELYIARTDGRGFLRLAHTRSQGTADAYWSQPRASVSRDGRWIVFSSDHGTSRVDTFILEVPRA